MHQTGRSVMEHDVVPQAFRERVRQGFIGTIIEEAARFGITMTPAEVEAKYPQPAETETAPNGVHDGSAEPAAPRRGRPRGSGRPTAPSETKDPAAIERGINAWNKRVREGKVPASVKAKIAAAGGDISVALKTLPTGTASAASIAAPEIQSGRRASAQKRGKKAFKTRVARFRKANPGTTIVEARKALMGRVIAGRTRKAQERKAAGTTRRRVA